MPPGTVNEMAAQFTAAYQALKDKKDAERLLTLIKPMILSAKIDGISDKELIDLINSLGLREKFYPTKLKELRGRLAKAEPEPRANDGENPASIGETLHPITATLSASSDGLTQMRLAELLGVAQHVVATYGSRQQRVPISMLSLLADTLAVTLRELIGAPIKRPGKRTRLLNCSRSWSALPRFPTPSSSLSCRCWLWHYSRAVYLLGQGKQKKPAIGGLFSSQKVWE